MAKIEIEVGRTLDDVGADFVSAWKTAETGLSPEAPERIVFRDWAALYAVLTPDRYELLRFLRVNPTVSEGALAEVLRRDLPSVHTDLVALSGLGLVCLGDGGELTVPITAIASIIHLAA